MVTDKMKKLEAARAKLATLEASIGEERSNELAALPAKYGFATTADFANAVYAATGGRAQGRRRGRKPRAAKAVRSAAKPAVRAGGKRRKRAVVTNETRAQVKKLVGQGRTGSEIAKALHISLPTVQNIKKALGLVRKR